VVIRSVRSRRATGHHCVVGRHGCAGFKKLNYGNPANAAAHQRGYPGDAPRHTIDIGDRSVRDWLIGAIGGAMSAAECGPA